MEIIHFVWNYQWFFWRLDIKMDKKICGFNNRNFKKEIEVFSKHFDNGCVLVVGKGKV